MYTDTQVWIPSYLKVRQIWKTVHTISEKKPFIYKAKAEVSENLTKIDSEKTPCYCPKESRLFFWEMVTKRAIWVNNQLIRIKHYKNFYKLLTNLVICLAWYRVYKISFYTKNELHRNVSVVDYRIIHFGKAKCNTYIIKVMQLFYFQNCNIKSKSQKYLTQRKNQ